jgi:hypothetical protein
MVLPVRPRLRDLFRCPRDEVPPHQDRFTKRKPTNQQQSPPSPSAECDAGSVNTEVVEPPFRELFCSDTAVSTQDEDSVLVPWIQIDLERLSCMHLQVGPEEFRIVPVAGDTTPAIPPAKT